MTYKTLAPNYYSRFTSVARNLSRGNIAVNVGCSEGYYDSMLSKRFNHVVGIDVNFNDLLVAKRRNPEALYIAASATNLPFKDRIFDEAICVDVLEHLKDDKKALIEIRRVLKDKKNAIITVPNKNYPASYDPINRFLSIFNRHLPIGLWGFGHLRLYSEDDLKNILASAGFKVLLTERMLHFFCGIFENYYLVNLIQPLTKHDPKNLDKASLEKKRKPKLIDKDPPKLLTWIRDIFMGADYRLFKKSKKSLGILVVARKK